ncbi:putative membrane protein [Rhodopseudomonas palustris HaA2]|uniref:Protoporphyrinogen IX oxidase n=1 Tax=Rhodopseudomonas palustris (strain HaA2) TaxID=316058 RepID=Q2J3U0_RHOP2|nr:CopD family protein [Rhodopseudomonas palustris]ABD04870.1 putative membrane protein [Rhodopseudomonas palustris HaA2]
MIAWLKAIHILALIVWCAGLLVLPGLFAQRSRLGRGPAVELNRFTRTLFIAVTSPAAFVAVVAGTTLLFMREVFTTWMMLKLLAVGLLVIIHMRAGYLILSVFEPEGYYAPWRRWVMTVVTVAVIGVILVLILDKPAIETAAFPPWMRQPGGLQSFVETIRPMP